MQQKNVRRPGSARGPARSPDAHPDVLYDVDVAAYGHGREHPYSLAAVTGAL